LPCLEQRAIERDILRCGPQAGINDSPHFAHDLCAASTSEIRPVRFGWPDFTFFS
jgi:hypothetical protein